MRATDYEFVDSDSTEILTQLIARYETLTGRTLRPADPGRLFLAWVADFVTAERVQQNYTGNQNIPSRAEGGNLDALGEFIFGVTRQEAQPAKCTVRFTISSAQTSAVLIPTGTRVTDTSQTLVWATTADAFIAAGDTSVDIMVQCQTDGTTGNGYAVGQINTLIDVDNVLYFSSCENTTESDGGAEEETDDDYYERMRLGLDSHSTAGAANSYLYWAKSVSDEIADVKAVRSGAGEVDIYALMDDGTLATGTIKNAILSVCSADDVRPLTDSVSVKDAGTVAYDITLTYYIANDSTTPATEIASNVTAAVNEYKEWQSAKLGRDINPSKLWQLLMATGIKRAVISSPVFTELKDGSDGSAPQLAVCGNVSVTSGGYEDE